MTTIEPDEPSGEHEVEATEEEPAAPPAETPEPGEDHSMDFVERFGPDES